jgi:hypothetical protein
MPGRAEFLKLTKMDAPALKMRSHRDQLPFDSSLKDRKRDTYTFFEVLLTLAADHLVDERKIPLNTAAGIVSRAAPLMTTNWDRIVAGSEAGTTAAEVLFGVAYPAAGRNFPICGTLAEIFQELQAREPLVDVTLSNASRAAAVLRVRAARESISIPNEFWSETPSYTERREITWDVFLESSNKIKE